MGESNKREFRVDSLPPYLHGEIAGAVVRARLEGRDIVDLSQMNPSLAPPPLGIDKLVQNSLLPHNHRYSASQGISRLRLALCNWYGRRWGVELDSEREVVVTMGVKEGLAHLLLSVLSPGETVILPTPSYPVHAAAVSIAGAGCVGLPLSEQDEGERDSVLETEAQEDSFFRRLDAVYASAWPRPRVMLLSFPHNPTAAAVSRSFFERLVETARSRGLYLIHDFAHADICFDGYHAPSLLEVQGAKEVAVECYSLSKGFGLAGWRIGFCVGNEHLISSLKRIKSYLDFGIFQPLQIAAAAVLECGEEVVEETAAVYRTRRDVLVEGLCSTGWKTVKPRATPFVWCRIPRNCSCDEVETGGSLGYCRRLLRDVAVAVSPGVGFGREADDFVRFALAENEQRLRLAVNRISSLVGGG